MQLASFYPIFDKVTWLERMLPLGIKLVQLRIKDSPDSVLREQIGNARELCKAHNCTLVVNDYWQIAIELGCDFVHLGQEDLDTANLAQIKRAGLRLGVSTHDQHELDRAIALKPDYIALGPIFPTILKKMAWSPQGIDRIPEWKAQLGDIPLVAIGGMSVARAKDAFTAGADIVSAVTDISLNADPEQRVREWLATCP